MEMDLAKVEIRWGNCEKMAGVSASGRRREKPLGNVEF